MIKAKIKGNKFVQQNTISWSNHILGKDVRTNDNYLTWPDDVSHHLY
jgi:hypothetical protein